MALRSIVGGRDSDSFVGLSEVDAILDKFFPGDTNAWDDLTQSGQEVRLQLAAHVIGTLPLRGRKVYCGQALCFPRSCQDRCNKIPDEVKDAQVYVAYSVIHRALASSPAIAESISAARVKSVSLGGLLSVAFAEGSHKGGNLLDRITRSPFFPVYVMLKRWLAQIRGGRIQNTDDDDYPSCSTTTTTTSTTTTTTS